MSYASQPHIERFLSTFPWSVGTGGHSEDQSVNVDFVFEVGASLIAGGWEVDTVQVSGSKGNYLRTTAATLVRITTQDLFDSFGFFSSVGPACDGLAVWHAGSDQGCLCIGIDEGQEPDSFSEVANCCICDCGAAGTGACDHGVTWGSSTDTTCQFGCNCDPPGCCIADARCTWSWPPVGTSTNAAFIAQHAALTNHVMGAVYPDNGFEVQALWTNTILDTSGNVTQMETWFAVWADGGTHSPLVGPVGPRGFSIGAAFNSTMEIFVGGWLLHSQEHPQNPATNKMSVWIQGSRDGWFGASSVDKTWPAIFSFTTYSGGGVHPVFYVETQTLGTATIAPIVGIADMTSLRNVSNSQRIIANPHQAFLYSYNTAGTTTGSTNQFSVGAVRIVPNSGEDPETPNLWSFKKALYHVHGGGTHLHQSNNIIPEFRFDTIVEGTTTTTASGGVADLRRRGIAGWHWTINNNNNPIRWKSGEALISEPWIGANIGTSVNGQCIGQLWDACVPSVPTGTGGPDHDESAYWFWDGEWWKHWQLQRTIVDSNGGAIASLSFRVGFKEVELQGPCGVDPTDMITPIWCEPYDPNAIVLWALLFPGGDFFSEISNPLELPWGKMVGVTINPSSISGGTETSTITVTCTKHEEFDDDYTKLVAIHTPRNFVSFNPPIISLGSGTTTGTSLITALSPGLGGVVVDIFAESIDQASGSITVND